MSLKDFQSYQLSLQFYRSVERLRCPTHLRSQLLRECQAVLDLCGDRTSSEFRDLSDRLKVLFK